MIRLSQNSPKWKNVLIGDSKTTIGEAGCLISSLCAIESKWAQYFHTKPDEAAKAWKFVSVPDDPEPKYLNWISTDFKGMEFVKRVRKYEPEEVERHCKDEDYGVAVQVQTQGGGVHWMACWGWGTMRKPVCYDSWDGGILWNPWRRNGKYKRPLGYAIMKRKEDKKK